MRNFNGGFVGARNTPTQQRAGGVWGVEEAFLADRDAVWPKWPTNIGLPFDSRLRIWLEHDYGLYQDVDANVPVTANVQPVRSWINRGNAGRLVCSLPTAPVRAFAGQADGVAFYASQQRHFDPLVCDVRAFNYVFVVDYLTTTSGRAKITTLASTAEAVANARWSPSLHGGNSQTGAGTATGYTQIAVPSTTTLNIHAQLTSVALSVGARQVTSSGANTILNAAFSTPASPTEITIGGVKGLVAPANLLTMFAVIWYSSDEPMSKEELNQVYAYLGTKYSKPVPVLA